MGKAQEAHSHRHAGLVGILRPFHQGGGADGALLHHLARLSYGRRKNGSLSGRGFFRRALYPDRSVRPSQKRAAQGAGKAVPRFHADIRFSGCHSGKQLDDAGCGNVQSPARGFFQTRGAAEDFPDGSGRGGEEPQGVDR
ncbi:hypothetical protein D3C78_1216080 [compost metagenome]